MVLTLFGGMAEHGKMKVATAVVRLLLEARSQIHYIISQQVYLKTIVISTFFLNFKRRCDQLKPFLYENI